MKSFLLKLLLLGPLAAAIIGAHLLPGLDTTELHAEVRNGLHIIAFALLAAVIFEMLPMRSTVAALATLLLVAAIGALSEYAQTRVGKPFGAADLTRDVMGAGLYLCARLLWRWTESYAQSTAARISGNTISVTLVMMLFAPLAYWLYADDRVMARYPTILDFEGRWDPYLYQPVNSVVSFVKTSEATGDFDETFAEIRLLDHDWSGLRINPIVSNWSSYEYVTMRAAIVGAYESRVVVSLNDGAHPGHPTEHRIGSQEIGPDPVTIRFPIRDAVDMPGRPALDPTNIRAIHIIGRTKSHTPHESGETRLYLDDIRLE